MVEAARDIRDRGYLAINLLLGGIAVAVGLFNMFVEHNFGAAPMFDAFLGISMVSVGVLFIAPYMAPRQLGLPAPGVRIERRPYLDYPVPIEEIEGEPEDQGTSIPAEELPVLPRPARRPAGGAARSGGVAVRSSHRSASVESSASTDLGPASAAEATATIAELESMGAQAPTPAPVPDVITLPPVQFPPLRVPETPPHAEYLEDHLPETTPELEPQFQKALQDLAGVAGEGTNGSHPLQLVNGKPPARTLSDLEDVLRQPSPSTPPGAVAQARVGPVEVASTSPQSAISEVDQLETELQSLPRLDREVPRTGAAGMEAVEPPSVPPVVELPGASGAHAETEVSSNLSEAPSPQGLVAETPPAPQVQPSPVAPAEAPRTARRLPTVEEAVQLHEAQLDEMARALEGMVSQIREEDGAAVPAPNVTSTESPTDTKVPGEVPRPAEPTVEAQASENFSEEHEPTPAIDDLERQLAAMRSALEQGPTPRKLPPPNRAGAESEKTGLRPAADLPMAPSAAPTPAAEPSAEVVEDDLQKALEEAESAVKLTQQRHEGRDKPEKRRKR